MPKTIWKYEISPNSVRNGQHEIRVPCPQGSRPLHIAFQGGVPHLWMEVDPAATTLFPDDPGSWELVLLCVGTGHGTVPDSDHWEYFQTLHQSPYVWHFYARKGN